MFRTNITIPTAVIYVKSHGIAYREIFRITWDFYVYLLLQKHLIHGVKYYVKHWTLARV